MHATTLTLLATLSIGQPDDVPDKVVLRDKAAYYSFAMAFSPDGRKLAAPDRGEVVVFDVAKPKEAMRLDAAADKKKFDTVTAVAFSADGKLLAIATREGLVKVWDLATGAERLAIKSQHHSLIAVAITADNKAVAAVTGSTPWTAPPTVLTVWEIADGKEIRRVKLSHRFFFVGELSFSVDGRRLLGARNGLAVWDVRTGRALYELDEPKSMSAAFSRDGKRFAALVAGDGIVVWEMATGKALHTLKPPKSNYVGGISFSHDGKHVAAAFTIVHEAAGRIQQTTAVQIWEIDSGKVLVERQLDADLHMIAFSPDGRRLALGNRNGHIQLWKNPIGQ